MPLHSRVTPPGEIVAALTAGYRPLVHPSALASSRPAGRSPAGAGARVRTHT